jgi:diguanylate cyclase (GGDEF)-like protein
VIPAWSTHQLVEFLACVSTCTDESSAVRRAVERAAEALEAEVAAFVRGDTVLTSIGFPAGAVPTEAVIDVAHRRAPGMDIAGLGPCRVMAVDVDDSPLERLLVARAGPGGFAPEEASLLSGMGRVLALTLKQIRMLQEERRLGEERERLAYRDTLTGLANRALFLDRLDAALADADRLGGAVSVLFIDLDRFKLVNDTLGHTAGDELLVEVSRRLHGCVRATDTVARFGGDEFAVLTGGGAKDAATIAERALRALRQPFVLSGKEVFIGASIGITRSQTRREDAHELLRSADVAMYHAKRQGKGRYEIFEPTMYTNLLHRLELEADLQRALEQRELTVAYQPIHSLRSGRIRGAEALLRWTHPRRGAVGPTEFIPIAEETGLILPIGRYVLNEACRQAARWQPTEPEGAPLTISVNLSPRQLQESDIVQDVARALAASGLPPRLLTLEVTESLLMNDSKMTRTKLRELKTLGVKLALDDFGTGYSSLAYLRQFPIDIIKIDKSFIDGVSNGLEESVLTQAIIRMAETLRLQTVAEGIEDPGQLAELVRMDCDLGQGYLFARPVTPETVYGLIRRDRLGDAAAPTDQPERSERSERSEPSERDVAVVPAAGRRAGERSSQLASGMRRFDDLVDDSESERPADTAARAGVFLDELLT